MTRNDIIHMAIDAIGGDMNGQDVQHLVWRLENFDADIYEFGPAALLKFAALVAAAEREKCAQVCELKSMTRYFDRPQTPMDCADSIRARSNHAPHSTGS